MRRSDGVVILVFLALAAIVIAYVWRLPSETRLYPLVLGVGILVVDLAFLGLSLYRRLKWKQYYRDLHDVFAGFRAGQFFGVLILSVLFAFFYFLFGLYLAAFLYVFCLLCFFQHNWTRAFIGASLFVVLLFVILHFVLHFPIYEGVVWK